MDGANIMGRAERILDLGRREDHSGRIDDRSARAASVAAIAASHAEDVDAAARFPHEAVAALKAGRLLGMMIPVELGGEGADVSAVADVCYRLGGACAATAMIFAMHQIKTACLVRHGAGQAWQDRFLRRVAGEQLLLASSTTEGRGGGNVRASSAPIDQTGTRIALRRDASVMSYGEEADAVVTVARRGPAASTSDQVLVVFTRDQYALTRTQTWDTLGMRGTRSAGFDLDAAGDADQVVTSPYGVIHTETMAPVAHLLWAAVWAGLAAGAVERSRLCLRKTVRSAAGHLPHGTVHFNRATATLRTLRALLADALGAFEVARAEPATLSTPDFQTSVSLLKVEASDLAVATVMSAMRACGLAGYRNDGETSLGRHLRDVLSAPIMINNDRILADLGAAPMLSQIPTSIWS